MEKQIIQDNQNNRQVAMSVLHPFSEELMQCLINMESPANRSEAKMDLLLLTNKLMPAGKPDFLSVIQYPKISSLIASEGRKKMLALMVLMVKDFCSSMNVVRNMNEDQMIEAGNLLLEECNSFRMEDYLMMFSLAKKGALDIKIYDRVDMQLISQMMDAFWVRRKRAGEKAQEAEAEMLDVMGDQTRALEQMDPEEARMINAGDKMGVVGEAIRDIINHSRSVFDSTTKTEALQQIKANPDYKNRHPNPAFKK